MYGPVTIGGGMQLQLSENSCYSLIRLVIGDTPPVLPNLINA